MKSQPGRPPGCRLLGPPFLVLVQGFSIKVLMQKYCYMTILVLVQGLSIKSAHVGHAYNHYRLDTDNECAFLHEDSL